MPLGPKLVGDPLTSELLDLICLMPDHQVDEIIKFVIALRSARGKGRRVTLEAAGPSGAVPGGQGDGRPPAARGEDDA
jgi:hypothetical protein